MKRISLVVLLLMFVCMAPVAGAATATFEDLTLAQNSYWNGSDGSGLFVSGDAAFSNNYNAAWSSWAGWAYSNTTDTTTGGWGNQYSAITGSGVNGSSNYAVAYYSSYPAPYPPTVSFGAATGEDYNTVISGAYFTNTTYAFMSMRDGDGFVDAFTQGDWQMLTITGIDANGDLTANSVDFMLADYRSANAIEHYIVDQWTWVDLTSLGNVIGLELSFSGPKSGGVPAYVAMDNLNGTSPVPVPAAFWLLGSGLLGIAGVSRRRT